MNSPRIELIEQLNDLSSTQILLIDQIKELRQRVASLDLLVHAMSENVLRLSDKIDEMEKK
jgi:predicted nuclease with TOPRIM domain